MSTQSNKQITPPPVEFSMFEKGGNMTSQWQDWFNDLRPTLLAICNNYHASTPPVTADQRDSINNPTDGAEIYNADDDKRQVKENGNWMYYNTSISKYANSTPRITTEQRDAISPLEDGMNIYNTDLKKQQIVEDGVWKTVTTS